MSNSEMEPPFPPEQADERKKLAKELRRHPIAHFTSNIFVAIYMVCHIAGTKEGRKMLSDPEFRKFLMDREQRTGLLEDAILSPFLYHPNEDGTSITRTDAAAGRWVAYDFLRPLEFFPKKVVQLIKGRILAFPLNEIIDNKPDDYTPTNLFNFFDIAHVLTLETPSIEDLLNYGLVRETTYERAFRETNAFDKFSKALAINDLNGKKIYQVTPKGNGLIMLSTDGGEKTKEKSRIKELVPQLGLRF